MPDEKVARIRAGGTFKRLSILVVILLGTFGVIVLATYFFPRGKDATAEYWVRLGILYSVTLFQPLLAFSYYFYRTELRWSDVDRIRARLLIEVADSREQKEIARQFEDYVKQYKESNAGLYFVIAVGTSWVVSVIGLSVWFLLPDILVTPEPQKPNLDAFPAPGSTRIVWFAILGSYLWGLRFVLRRYLLNDLIPGAFYNISIRIVYAAAIAFIVFNAYDALADTSSPGAKTIWPALAFLIGTFPHQGIQWLTDRISVFSPKPNATVRTLPLNMIEGIDPPDEPRLQEMGIDSCHDLANADFFPIFIQSEYNARQIVDWILQAKLCVYCGDSIKGLREHGIRTILDLQYLDEETEETAILAKQTSASESCLIQARNHAKGAELTRLMYIGGLLGQFTPVRDMEPPESNEA